MQIIGLFGLDSFNRVNAHFSPTFFFLPRAKDTVLIKEDRDIGETRAAVQIKEEPLTTLTLEGYVL